MQNILTTLQLISLDFNIADFKLHKTSKAFDIYHYKKDVHVELAVLREGSKPHYHTNEKVFYFFMNEALLTLGALDSEGKPHYEEMKIIKNNLFLILPYMIHAVAPESDCGPCYLLMYNPETVRERSDEYPVDTFFV